MTEPYLVLVAGTVCRVITVLLEDVEGGDVSHHSVDSLLRLGEVDLVSSCAV